MHKLDVLLGADSGYGSVDVSESCVTRPGQAVSQVFVTVKVRGEWVKTRLLWNSVRLTFRVPSNVREVSIEDTAQIRS